MCICSVDRDFCLEKRLAFHSHSEYQIHREDRLTAIQCLVTLMKNKKTKCPFLTQIVTLFNSENQRHSEATHLLDKTYF